MSRNVRQMRMKSNILTLLVCAAFLIGCSRQVSDSGIYATETSHACVTIKALNALAAGDTNRATYLMQVEALMAAPTLLHLEQQKRIPERQRNEAQDYLRELLTYFENHGKEINPRLPMTRHCVDALEQMLTAAQDRSRLDAIKRDLENRLSNQASQDTSLRADPER